MLMAELEGESECCDVIASANNRDIPWGRSRRCEAKVAGVRLTENRE